jgi:hypothetical protein
MQEMRQAEELKQSIQRLLRMCKADPGSGCKHLCPWPKGILPLRINHTGWG